VNEANSFFKKQGDMSKFHVVHTVASLHSAAGGPSRTITHLTDKLAGFSDLTVAIVTQHQRGESEVPSTNPAVNRIKADAILPLASKLGLPLRRALQSHMIKSQVSLLHDHGLWMPNNHWVARTATEHSIPLIVQPRGMLEPWAMNYKLWKKRMAMVLYQWRNLQSAKVLIATAASEYENLRTLGLRQAIAVIPNGVNLQMDIGEQARPKIKPKQHRTALFLSRVQEKKGLLNLIDAWAQIRPNGWRLQIAGPDEGGHLAEVLARAKRAGVGSVVDYVGVVDGEAKSQLYHNADLFVLPTYSENFGVVVAEALAHGLPVITTRGAPWQDLESYKCGWWIEIGSEPLGAALSDAIMLNDDERQAMGARGRDYVRRYDWNDIAAQTVDVYRWVLGQGEMPDCVQSD